jgi:hypothetical protein
MSSKTIELLACCAERQVRVQLSVKGLSVKRVVDVVTLAVARWSLPTPLSLFVRGVPLGLVDVAALVEDARSLAARGEAIYVRCELCGSRCRSAHPRRSLLVVGAARGVMTG